MLGAGSGISVCLTSELTARTSMTVCSSGCHTISSDDAIGTATPLRSVKIRCWIDSGAASAVAVMSWIISSMFDAILDFARWLFHMPTVMKSWRSLRARGVVVDVIAEIGWARALKASGKRTKVWGPVASGISCSCRGDG
jgi:hypothetical protein